MANDIIISIATVITCPIEQKKKKKKKLSWSVSNQMHCSLNVRSFIIDYLPSLLLSDVSR